MDIKIDEKLVRDVVSSAIMNSLSQDQRNTLITNAVAFLIAPPAQTGYGGSRQPSPLESAFNDAMRHQASKVASEMLENNSEVKEKLHGLIAEAMQKLFTDNRDATIDKIVRAVAEGISGKGY